MSSSHALLLCRENTNETHYEERLYDSMPWGRAYKSLLRKIHAAHSQKFRTHVSDGAAHLSSRGKGASQALGEGMQDGCPASTCFPHH